MIVYNHENGVETISRLSRAGRRPQSPEGQNVVVIGYGNQGRAQALNLRDSGIAVLVAGIPDSSSATAEADGFRVIPIAGCAQKGDVLMFLIPDEVQRKVYEESLLPDLRAGHTLCFGHGYNYHYRLIRPPADIDVILVAPRMIGTVVRRAFENGQGVPAYVAVGQDGSGKAKDIMLAVAKGIGSTRAGAVEMSFESETILDLFVEQTILPVIIKSMVWGFEILVEAGFDPGIVTLEMYGSGEIAEVFRACAETGFFRQMQFHSRTAQYGELSRGKPCCPNPSGTGYGKNWNTSGRGVRSRMGGRRIRILPTLQRPDVGGQETPDQRRGSPDRATGGPGLIPEAYGCRRLMRGW